MRSSSPRVAALLLAAMGLVMGGMVFWSASPALRLSSRGVRATGYLESFVTAPGRGETRRLPVIRFRDSSGAERTVRGRNGTYSTLRPGDPVDVIYDPADPELVSIADFQHLWLLPAALAAGNWLLIGAAVWAEGQYRRWNRWKTIWAVALSAAVFLGAWIAAIAAF